jgi:hypothetical protein
MPVKLTQNQGFSDPAATKATTKTAATKSKKRSDLEYPKRERTTQKYDGKRIFH